MKKYQVTIPEMHTLIVEVIGDNEHDAIRKAENDVAQMGQDLSAVYDHTLDKNQWKVQLLGEVSEEEQTPNPFQRGEMCESLENEQEEVKYNFDNLTLRYGDLKFQNIKESRENSPYEL